MSGAAAGGMFGAAVDLVGLGMSAVERDKATKEQQRLLERLRMEYGEIPLPVLERIVAEQMGPSELGQVGADPAMRSAQLAALAKFRQMAEGPSLEEEAEANRIGSTLARRATASRQSILQDMAARGQVDSGASVAAQLHGAQNAAEMARQSELDLRAQAQRRGMEAWKNYGGMAGSIEDRDYAQRARAAQARDEINRWNTQARQNAQQYNAGLAQQHWANRMSKVAAMNPTQATAQMNLAHQGGEQAARNWQAFGGAAGDIIRQASSYYPQQDWSGTGYADEDDYYARTPSRLGGGWDK